MRAPVEKVDVMGWNKSLAGWDGWTGWDVREMGVGWRDRRQQAPERQRHHWLLGDGRRWEAVSGTNCVSAARERSICVGAEK